MFSDDVLSLHHIPYRNFWKTEEIWLPARRIDGGRACRAVWRTQNVHANYEIFIRVEEFPFTHHSWPPFRRIRVGGERMANPNDLVLAVPFRLRSMEGNIKPLHAPSCLETKTVLQCYSSFNHRSIFCIPAVISTLSSCTLSFASEILNQVQYAWGVIQHLSFKK